MTGLAVREPACYTHAIIRDQFFEFWLGRRNPNEASVVKRRAQLAAKRKGHLQRPGT